MVVDLELRLVSTGNSFETPPISSTDHGSLDLTTVGTVTVPTDPLDGSGIGAEIHDEQRRCSITRNNEANIGAVGTRG